MCDEVPGGGAVATGTSGQGTMPQEGRYTLTPLGQKLAADNIRLAYKMARRYRCWLDPEDADSLAMEAMISAIAFYGPATPVKLSTAIGLRIRCRLNHERDRLVRRQRRLSPASLATLLNGEPYDPLDTRECQPGEAEERRMLDGRWQAVLDAADKLHERQRLILKARMDGDTLDAIGARLGITGERVRQIEAKAIKSVRRRLVPAVA